MPVDDGPVPVEPGAVPGRPHPGLRSVSPRRRIVAALSAVVAIVAVTAVASRGSSVHSSALRVTSSTPANPSPTSLPTSIEARSSTAAKTSTAAQTSTPAQTSAGSGTAAPGTAPSGTAVRGGPPTASRAAPGVSTGAQTTLAGRGTVVSAYPTPWAGPAQLRTGLTAVRTVTGTCFTSSIADATSGSWRCIAGNAILDPCFSGPGRTNEVVCVPDPWTTAVVRMHLSSPLPAAASGTDTAATWAIELATGQRCVLGTGANGTFANSDNGVQIAFECSDGSATSKITASGATWTVDLDRHPQASAAYIVAKVSRAWVSHMPVGPADALGAAGPRP